MSVIEPYRVIVCGGRHYANAEAVRAAFAVAFWELRSDLRPLIVHGGATGADALADAEARRCGYDVEVHPADWDRFGSRAGPIRNREMAEAGASECIAFWDGSSRGTASMIALAVRHGIRCTIIPA